MGVAEERGEGRSRAPAEVAERALNGAGYQSQGSSVEKEGDGIYSLMLSAIQGYSLNSTLHVHYLLPYVMNITMDMSFFKAMYHYYLSPIKGSPHRCKKDAL